MSKVHSLLTQCCTLPKSTYASAMGFKYITEVSAAEPNANPAKGPTYRSTLAKDGFASTGGITSLYDSFQKSVKGKFADNPCLGWRPLADGKAGDFKWLTYAEVGDSPATSCVIIQL